MADAIEGAVREYVEKFAAPGGTVFPEPRTVHGESPDVAVSESVFPGDGSDVRVVMLDENEGKSLFGRLPGGFAGGEKVGMPVAGVGFGRHVEELEKMRDG